MNNDPASKRPKKEATLAEKIGARTALKLRKRRDSRQGVWFGLGMMGLIGWSVVVPTLVGAALGVWMDKHHPGNHTWTLPLLVAGLTIGCFTAGHWVSKEEKTMRDEEKETHE